jgi:osmoprotectant transport system permease protein
MSGASAEALAALPDLVRAHVLLSGAALAIGVADRPAARHLGRRHRLVRTPVLGLAGLIQTVPALALLALFYPPAADPRPASGLACPALGFLPALIALSLYALLPIVRNGVAARRASIRRCSRRRTGRHDPAAAAVAGRAAARRAGDPRRHPHRRGLDDRRRDLATTVGQPSLGNLIFSGLQTENWVRVLVGCAAAAALALAVDGLLALVEIRPRSAARAGGSSPASALARRWPLPSRRCRALGRGRPTVVIGAKNFSEQYILAAALAERRLHAAGYRTELREDLGSAVAYRALAAGDIDVYVDYGGHAVDQRPRPHRQSAGPRRCAPSWPRAGARDGVWCSARSASRMPMRWRCGASRGARARHKLDRRSRARRAAAPPRQRHRIPEPAGMALGPVRLRPDFAGERSYSPTFMYRAVADGSADVISAFSSDGRIAALDLVTLADPRHALPSYEAVLLVSPRRAGDARFLGALRPLIGAIPIERMRQANLMVDRDVDKKSPDEAARWLDPGGR